ncbi:ribosome biogenesis protein NOP53 [Rhodotorula paludigena]|uniref:ribosome biogenesis protein NOP53 n=1 Tax=Rhodotorula paludigena TaxID=86838 RepID=UPI00317CF6F7
MPKHRANSKKAAPTTQRLADAAELDRPLFEIDSAGSSAVRHALQADQAPAAARLRRGQSFKKPLRSELILAQRSAVPALSSRVTPSADAQAKRVKDKLGKVDRATKDKLKRLTGRAGQGDGLWGVQAHAAGDEALAQGVKEAGRYDAWAQAEPATLHGAEDATMQAVLDAHDPKRRPKAPTSLTAHTLLSSAQPKAISIPHPGSSYNPAHEHHQALLSSALESYTAAEERDERGQDTKAALDTARQLARGREAWEAFEDEVGSGEDDDEAMIVDPDAHAHKELLKRRAAKRKTKQQRTAKVRVAAEQRALADRRAMKKRVAAVQHVRDVDAGIAAAEHLSLEEKALALKARRARLADRGLARFRSGPARVPDAPVTFQLGDELADNLRTLQPEGNLWKEWVNSGMRRGRVPVERANEGKKGGKRGGHGHDKGHGMREVEKFSYKNWTG